MPDVSALTTTVAGAGPCCWHLELPSGKKFSGADRELPSQGRETGSIGVSDRLLMLDAG